MPQWLQWLVGALATTGFLKWLFELWQGRLKRVDEAEDKLVASLQVQLNQQLERIVRLEGLNTTLREERDEARHERDVAVAKVSALSEKVATLETEVKILREMLWSHDTRGGSPREVAPVQVQALPGAGSVTPSKP